MHKEQRMFEDAVDVCDNAGKKVGGFIFKSCKFLLKRTVVYICIVFFGICKFCVSLLKSMIGLK